MAKSKRALLDELKQLKVRQRCIERNIVLPSPAKYKDLDNDELEAYKEVDRLKINTEKSFIVFQDECKMIVRDCMFRVKKFQNNIINFDKSNFDKISQISSEPIIIPTSPTNIRSSFLNTMAELNILLSENLYIANKELTSLRYKIERD
jgi:hypothetical protein